MSEPSAAVKVKRVVAGILVRGDEILCCQRSHNDPMSLKWEFPGGKIEPNETAEAALARELVEELNLAAEIGPLVETIRHSYTAGVIIELYFFRIDRWQGEPENRVFADIRWVPRIEMPKLDFLEADLGLVKEIAEGKRL
ncbi:NUDIX hydrolase [Candidatus Koribacter versatilis Ellin345]|uniref:8-oxo-dGTP diphosphatase n=1 Tax=Koribacter versatilis (strain Ellin345) TaxID=204669 RepID=Q1IN95_KORVE|nr:(deoxy)nucleoside triphosphate pyrophosphohydrolase [Candidatus Koribacter versatilis]ABF41655.1 NUDIX hydrolase [Candidatus Koribacter versatilis Ellin345]